jgi:hypothetical protein
MLMRGFFFVHGFATGEASYPNRPCFPAMLASCGKYTSHRSWMLPSTRTVSREPMTHVRQTRIPSVEGDEPCEPETTLATTAGTPDIQEHQ